MGSGIRRRPDSHPNRPQTPPIGYTASRPLRNHKDDIRGENILVAGDEKDIENKVQECTACLASSKNIKYQLPKIR